MAKQWRTVLAAMILIVFLLLAAFSLKVPNLKMKHQDNKTRSSTDSKRRGSVSTDLNETEISKSKKNSSAIESATVDPNSKCWKTEKTESIGQCVQCSSYEKRTILGCVQTGNIQLVFCTSSGVKAYISCPQVKWWEERKFWTFEGSMLVLLVFSSFMVWYRQRQLDEVFLQKLRKQVKSDTV